MATNNLDMLSTNMNPGMSQSSPVNHVGILATMTSPLASPAPNSDCRASYQYMFTHVCEHTQEHTFIQRSARADRAYAPLQIERIDTISAGTAWIKFSLSGICMSTNTAER